MDNGNVAEFDTPLTLFAQGGIFSTMCERSNISIDDIKKAQGDRAGSRSDMYSPEKVEQ